MDPQGRIVTDLSVIKLLLGFDKLRVLHREIHGQLVSAVLYVVSHGSCHKLSIEEDLGLSTASSSRHSDWLSDHHRLDKPGLGLIRKYKDYRNYRRVVLELTPKGEALFVAMDSTVFGVSAN
jgi:DNA-binding MarR family transcriptional regulator